LVRRCPLLVFIVLVDNTHTERERHGLRGYEGQMCVAERTDDFVSKWILKPFWYRNFHLSRSFARAVWAMCGLN